MGRTGFWITFTAAAAVSLGATAIWHARARWRRETAALAAAIGAGAMGASRTQPPPDAAGGGTPPHHGLAAEVPPPVRRYLAASLPHTAELIHTARLVSTGMFRQVEPGASTDPDAGWMPFTATQTVGADPPAFVWDALIRMMPGLDILVRDAYCAGRGSMHASLLGAVPLVAAQGDAELDAGALMRYLAEAPWFPAVLRPGPFLQWSAGDDAHATATLTYAGCRVSVDFEFDAAGDIVGVAARRYRAAGGGYQLDPWAGRFWQHETRGGVRIPTRGEVAWMVGGRAYPYWRGQITAVRYDRAPAASPG